MIHAHWSNVLLSFVTVEIAYADGARQTWDYDCSKFATIEDMQLNMTADFTDTSGYAANPHSVRTDWDNVMLYITRNGDTYTVDLGDVSLTTGQEFANLIFDNIREALGWQPAVIS